MGEMTHSHEMDVARLLSMHYEEGKMDDAFRIALQERTRHMVGARGRTRMRRWALVAVGAAAVAVAVVMLARSPAPPTTERPSPAVAERAPTPAPPPVNAAAGSEQRQTAATSRSTGPEAAGPTERPAPAGGAVQAGGPLVAVISARAPVSDATGRALEVGNRLAVGAIVRTGKGGRVSLYTRRGSEYTLNADTELVVASRTTAELRRGEVYCRSRGGEIERIDTAAGKIHLLGTVVDAAAQNGHRVAVTVVSGKVRLSNAHGEALVQAGRRSVLVASLPPQGGAPVNTFAATAWYDSKGTVLSDFGDIAYGISRGGGLVSEIWVMKGDGADKRRLKSYLGFSGNAGPWLPGQQRLLVDAWSALWTTPDFEHRRAHASAGHPIVTTGSWLLNAATGQDVPFQLPAGYNPLYMEVSPDATRLAFCGSYQRDPEDLKTAEGGIWVYDLETGEMKKVLDGWIKTPVAWAPDSRRLAASTGQGYGNNYPLVVVDADTAEVTDLKIQGAGASFSPDGTSIAYCGDFRKSGSWSRGVPTSGSIFVLDLGPGGEPRRVSPEGEGALQPRWSPDGARILYMTIGREQADEKPRTTYALHMVSPDGPARQEVYRGEGYLSAATWTPAGDAIYAVTKSGVLLVAADGSGVISDLGGNDKDSVLPPDRRAQTAAALEALQEAIFQFAVGKVRSFEGRPDDARAAFQRSADIFAGLPWRHPLADFSTSDILRYADKAQEMANRPAQALLAESCRERMSYAGILLPQCAADQGRFPSDLASLEKWSLGRGWGINWLSGHDTAWVKMIFRCPQGDRFTYTAPPAGEEPKAGDVLLSCPNHPDCRFVWDDQQARMLAWHRQSAARRARERDPELKELADTAGTLLKKATRGLVPWPQVEQAYRAVLKRSPDDPEMRETLGRMYTRWGRYREALETLPQNSEVLGGWAGLNRAFCLDALGKRAEAVAIYAKLAEFRADSAIGAWARLGLNGPIWPRDLDLHADPAEVRLMPTAAWRASASDSADLAKPEYAIDGNLYSRWGVGEGGQEPGQWFRLDFDTPQSVCRIVLDHQGRGTFYTNDWPRGLRAEVTADGTTWEEVPVVQGDLLQPAMVRFAMPRSIRGIRFTLTAGHGPEWWSIYELYVFGPAR